MGNSEISAKLEMLEAEGMAVRQQCDVMRASIIELLEKGERPGKKILLDMIDVFYDFKEEEKELAWEHQKLSAILEDRVTNGVGGE